MSKEATFVSCENHTKQIGKWVKLSVKAGGITVH